jgi:hypothetical protein
MADRLRATEFVPTTVVVPKAGPFPRAGELAENLVRVVHGGELRWKQVAPRDYIEGLKPYTKKGAGDYQIPMVRRGEIVTKKNGQPVMQKKRTQALRDIYISLPPWVTEGLSELATLDGGLEKVRRVTEQAALAAAEALEARSGYKAVGIAIHPDSKYALGVHIQYLTVEDGQLIGRSRQGLDGKGGRGRRGLRLAGDVNCALHRFSKVREIPGNWNRSVSTRDYDDIAMLDAMDASIQELMPNIDYSKEHYVDEWLMRRKKPRDLIESEVEQLTEEKKKLEAINQQLMKKISTLERSISLTNIKTATDREPIPVQRMGDKKDL